MLDLTPVKIAIEEMAMNPSRREYSTRSWPSVSHQSAASEVAKSWVASIGLSLVFDEIRVCLNIGLDARKV